jgi:hydrogenase-4 component F
VNEEIHPPVILLAIIVLPVLGAGLAYSSDSTRRRTTILMAAAALHVALTALLWRSAESALGGWLATDDFGLVVLALVSVLFFAVASYTVPYLRRAERGGTRSSRAFVPCMLSFLAAASLVSLSHHLALVWIGMEGTTLSLAPLVFQRRDRRSLEAVWKYLVLSSVGIALALLGVFLLATSQPVGVAGGRPLVLDDMIAHARALDPVWLRAAFVFIAIGFGTKMGLAPMHSWKPDTYGEAPPLVGGLMAGGLTSCAFLGLARVTSICFAAGQDAFVRPVLVGFGMVSLVIAAAFIIGQRDIRRLLAYSSVEHMGLLVLGLGLGGAGVYGAVLHAVNNGLVKGLLFLAVGNIVLARRTSVADELHGVTRSLPVTGVLLLIGLFAVTGSPPFGMFVSEYTIVRSIFDAQHTWLAGAVIVLLAVIFVGLAAMFLELAFAPPATDGTPMGPAAEQSEPAALLAAPILLGVAVLMLGVYIPPPLASALARAAQLLGGHAP